MIARSSCILCDNSQLTSIAKIDIPQSYCTAIGTKNVAHNIEYGYCKECYSVQLMQLLPLEILYGESHFQPLNKTQIWIHHNISLAKFIIENVDTSTTPPMVEIGSSSFCLGRHLYEFYDYTIFDYSLETSVRREGVKYIEGNCETFDFESNTSVIMSHVFEHLYNPKKFIQNCAQRKVKNIIISVPNMMDSEQFHINVEHTFLYSDNDIEHIFGLFNYKLKDRLQFNTQDSSFPCQFFSFELTSEPILIERIIDATRHLFSVSLLKKRITIPAKTYIATCHAFSVLLYALIENKENVAGVIDLDTHKQNMWFSVTNLIVQPYEILRTLGADAYLIVLHPKKTNILHTAKQYNSGLSFIIL